MGERIFLMPQELNFGPYRTRVRCAAPNSAQSATVVVIVHPAKLRSRKPLEGRRHQGAYRGVRSLLASKARKGPVRAYCSREPLRRDDLSFRRRKCRVLV